MARRDSVSEHPDREQIIKGLIEGRSYRDIAAQYGLSKSALSRYVRKVLSEKLVAANREESIIDGGFIADTFNAATTSLRKQLEACGKALEDPEDPTRYTMASLATEIDVVYQLLEKNGRSGKRRRATLQTLIDRIEGKGSISVEKCHLRGSDPRRSLIKTADAICRQLKLVHKVRAKANELHTDKEERRRIVESEVWSDVQYLLADAVSDCPEAREKLLAGLDWLKKKHSSS